jgi:nucleotide-binding universal stress UspA family protein
MAIKDILLTFSTYPEPTPASVVDDAIALALMLEAHIAAISCEAHVEVPGTFLSFGMVGSIVAGEAHKSRASAKNQLAVFEQAAQKAALLHETIFECCRTSEVPGRLVEYARMRDLTIVPAPESYFESCAETVIFRSGRPTLVLPEAPPAKPFSLNTIMVAWDFSRAAARAVADATPLLEKAKQVRILTVTNEKTFDSHRSSEELAKNLSRHDIDVILDKVDAAGRSIGKVIRAQAASCEADLLVMGAYGHSRFREFVLGGATHDVLSKPPIPVLFSH